MVTLLEETDNLVWSSPLQYASKEGFQENDLNLEKPPEKPTVN